MDMLVGNLKKAKLIYNWKAFLKDNIALSTVSFPSLCPRCLGKADLTSYTVRWRKEKIKIPICKSCKKTALWKARKDLVIIFAIWAPICWGILLLLGFTGILWTIIQAWGFPWGLFLPTLLVGIPLYALYFLIRSFGPSAEAGWPATLEQPGTVLAFENEIYVKMFAATNTERLERVVDWAASPPKELDYT